MTIMTTTLINQVFLTSINKELNTAKSTGKLDLKVLTLYSLYIYYIEFTNDKPIYNEINRQLKETVALLKYKYPDIICNYKLYNGNKYYIREENTAPTVSDNSIDLEGAFTRVLKIEDFTKDFYDAEFDSWDKIMITPDYNSGDNYLYIIENNNLKLVTNTLEIDSDLVNNLIIIIPDPNPNAAKSINPPINKLEIDYNIKFRVSDNYLKNSLYSKVQNLSITNSEYIENYPPTIGDISVTADNRAETILTLDMFTTQMQPPYNDPEGDLIDAIRIDSISTSNEGIFYYDNNPIEVGDIITREDISDGLFKHIGPNIDSLSGDSIDFSARDEGSQEWVQ